MLYKCQSCFDDCEGYPHIFDGLELCVFCHDECCGNEIEDGVYCDICDKLFTPTKNEAICKKCLSTPRKVCKMCKDSSDILAGKSFCRSCNYELYKLPFFKYFEKAVSCELDVSY